MISMTSAFRSTLGLLACAGLLLGAAQARDEFSAADVYRNASPGVVVIFSYDASGSGSSGTGSIITPDGKILTNNHVVFDPNKKATYENIRVFFKPEHISGDPDADLKVPYKVKVISRDEAMDLAVLQVIDPPRGLRVIGIRNSETVDVGSPVAAIGHPGGGGLWTLTTGTISSTRKDGARDVFQTDTAINPGNSGGPLLDGDAHLVGVNTFVRRVNAQGLPLEGLNYSLRSGMARDWLAARGVRVAFVSSQPSRAPTPTAPPAVEPRQAPAAPIPPPPAPRASAPELAPPAPAPRAPERPRPQVRIDPEEGPRSTPRPHASAPPPVPPKGSREPAPKDAPREFIDPDGERMYGVPMPSFSLDAERNKIYESTIRNAQKEFDELDDW